ncbi:hypothetical protein [Burkholderia sp. Ac-20365]|jgi:hypothetical protein|uniref:hypothetical protein n=1 Tax=Burkholderia sp. Ac-20365 TaxID=2703897 RepID=UPI00197B2523|nr:hypothetical protein [Burkholderia sp. Ac-20365]MBN3762381.1 hypothetical protein [Burkholderia sp. Ac-20365]
MNKISAALLASLLAVAGVASAQTSGDGIVMTHDRAVAAQIEQHARDVQARPAIEQDVDAPAEKLDQKSVHEHHGYRKAAKPGKAHNKHSHKHTHKLAHK